MQHILVSACLLGVPVRYNGADVTCSSEILQRWVEDGRVIAVCPEVDAGLPMRRPAAEVSDAAGGNGVLAGTARVLEKTGGDVTREFLAGAERVAEVAKQHGIRLAILRQQLHLRRSFCRCAHSRSRRHCGPTHQGRHPGIQRNATGRS